MTGILISNIVFTVLLVALLEFRILHAKNMTKDAKKDFQNPHYTETVFQFEQLTKDRQNQRNVIDALVAVWFVTFVTVSLL